MTQKEIDQKKFQKTKRFKPRLVTKNKFLATSTLTTTPKRRPILKIVITEAALAFILLLTPPATAKSLINPLSQAYSVSDGDQFARLTLKRTYSSGSVFRGHFGPGWCSEFDGRVSTYAGGELRYRGCDVDSADLVDARIAGKSVRRTSAGFERKREDGAKQFFNSAGYLSRVIRTDGEFTITRDADMNPQELVILARNTEARFKIEIETRQNEACFALIRFIGKNVSYVYRDGLLTNRFDGNKITSSYSYDDQLNMTTRLASGESEIIEYDDLRDRVVRIERSSAFGRERLLLAIARNEKSGMIEMKIEVERGAEMHPVRILYDTVTHRVSLEGDRNVAKLLLNWIRA